MKVCYFGIYDPAYSRNRILIRGLIRNGIEVIECRSAKRGFLKYVDLVQKHWGMRNSYDAMAIGFPGYQAMILARFLTQKPIIFDCFTSAYDSLVWDRKQARPMSIRAAYYWLLDWFSMWLADMILFDTQAHIDYASEEFGIPKIKFRRIWIGADTNIFSPKKVLWKTLHKVSPFPVASLLLKAKPFLGFPQEQKEKTWENNLNVLFFGTFIPLQGIEYIIGAAKRLEKESIQFLIIGNGQMKKKIVCLAGTLRVSNVTFIDLLPQEMLVQKIAEADVCLGIFGNTTKTQRVIPNKVYECLAMKKPVITADTPAARELLGDEDVYFVQTADSASLAEGILRFKNDKSAMESIAQNGYDTFIKNATPEILGRELKGIVEESSCNMKHGTCNIKKEKEKI